MLENELIAFYFQMFTYHAPGFYITTEFGKLDGVSLPHSHHDCLQIN